MSANTKIHLQKGDALIIVDLQNDFLPGGALAVPEGDAVIPVLNRYLKIFETNQLPIIATRDWHPANHCSFKIHGGPWPVHCVMNTYGAAFTTELKLPPTTIVISKPSTVDRETYSAFEGTTLEKQLRDMGVRRAFVGGLATDYCVFHTTCDALKGGFETFLLADASRAVNVKPTDGEEACRRMTERGAGLVQLQDLA